VSLSRLGRLVSEDPLVSALGEGELGRGAVTEAVLPLVLVGAQRAARRRPVLVATASQAEAERVAAALEVFVEDPSSVGLLPAWETLPFERVSPSPETMGRRLEVIWRLAEGSVNGPLAPLSFVVAPVRALLQRMAPLSAETRPVHLRAGGPLEDGEDPEELVRRLVRMGYRREYQVEHRGEVARRGSIVDVFPPKGPALRADFFGDDLERLSSFDVGDQRSTQALQSAWVHAVRELVPDETLREKAAQLASTNSWARERFEKLAEGVFFDGMESWLPWLSDEELLASDLLGAEALVVLYDPARIEARAGELLEEEASLADALASTWGLAPGEEARRLHLSFQRLIDGLAPPAVRLSPVPESPSVPAFQSRGWTDLAPGDVPRLARRLADLSMEGYAVVLCAGGEASARRMSDALRSEGVVVKEGADPSTPGVHVVVAPLDAGFLLPAARLAVVTENDVTGRHRVHRRPADHRQRRKVAPTEGGEGFFTDLAPGDFVVHRHHGVGRYMGMVRRALGGAERDYLLIAYRGDDKLYVPSDQLDQLTRYSGGETPTLNRLGGADFQRTRQRVRQEVDKIAQELVVLYSKRMASPGYAFGPDTPWQKELEDSFPFEETPDQLAAIEAVKRDMEAPRPMDRIICGDVGFGKTEIALRAAFKAVQNGKQVAVMVPTTLLAQQHYETFSERLANFPVRVEVLSRFLTQRQADAVKAGLADGSVDIVIGTHRLLADDVKIRDLGLLVVDEEQRFGVSHKEAIKAMTSGVDVLTLAATPIPRTLEMGLTGIRDITVLKSPPEGRQPILTYVGPYDEAAVIEAVRRELLREGQVFFVHNRVRDIYQVAKRLGELVPEARIVVAHGQMDESSLEQAAMDFADRRYDVLCCTTIIESGIDMPTVNTMIVDRADLLGLGQLHQLRGRVGRAGVRAYAYLFHPPEVTLTEEAFERLRTIGEMTELGSGLKIAMRDLEIRGSGNLLGRDQSGHIAAVGYDLYVSMVSEALAALKGEEPPRTHEVAIDVSVDAYLPDDYVSRDDLRVEAYRALATVESSEAVASIEAEWRDRFGPPPPPAEELLAVARLRVECIRCGIEEVTVVADRHLPGSRRVARLSPVRLAASAAVRLKRLYPDALYKEPGATSPDGVSAVGSLVVPVPKGADPPRFLVELLGELVREQ
jgi:transcription-repair coupling factor (superfamily II helicase)